MLLLFMRASSFIMLDHAIEPRATIARAERGCCRLSMGGLLMLRCSLLKMMSVGCEGGVGRIPKNETVYYHAARYYVIVQHFCSQSSTMVQDFN